MRSGPSVIFSVSYVATQQTALYILLHGFQFNRYIPGHSHTGDRSLHQAAGNPRTIPIA